MVVAAVVTSSKKTVESMETLSEDIVVLVPIAAELLRSADDKLLEAANDACEAVAAEVADGAMVAMPEAEDETDEGGVLIVRST